MRRILVVLVIAIGMWVAYYWQRLYLRDFGATVFSNEVRQAGAEVYLNPSKDLLIRQDGEDDASVTMLQHWDRIPSAPAELTCLRWLGCLSSTSHIAPPTIGADGKPYDPKTSMETHSVTYVDRAGKTMRIAL